MLLKENIVLGLEDQFYHLWVHSKACGLARVNMMIMVQALLKRNALKISPLKELLRY